jgi:MFS family permease
MGAMAETSDGRARFRDALRHREFRLLLGSYGVSWSGDWCYSIALTVWVVQQTHSTNWVAAVFVARFLPYVLFGAPGGVLADRLDRRRLMVGLDITRGLLMVPLILVVAADGPVLVGAVITFLVSSFGAVTRPAVVASTPRVVGEEDLAAANALETVVAQLTVFAGPALASLLLETTSIEVALGFNALTFAVSALLVAGVRSAGGGRANQPGSVSPDAATEPGPKQGVLRELTVGWKAIRSTSGLTIFTFLLAGALLAWGAEDVLMVLVATENLGTGPQGIGLISAATGFGGLVIAPFMARLVGRAHLASLLAGSLVLAGLAMALMSLPRSVAPALAVAFVEGIALILFEVAALTLLQRAVAPEVLGRVYGLQDSLNAGATLVGTVMVPLFVTLVGLDVTLMTFGIALTITALLSIPGMRPLDEQAARRARQLAPSVDVLAGLPMFEGASRAALERLAGTQVEERVIAGTVVIREGDEADDLYVIREGAFDVLASMGPGSAGPKRVTQLGRDEVFGEIGLVQRVARTATIVAATDGVLWRISGAVFVDALAASANVPGAMTSTIAARLAGLGRTTQLENTP